MIENTSTTERLGQQLRRKVAKRKIAPSKQLRRHFVALARQVQQWSADRPDNFGGCSIGVTSFGKGAGKSTISFNLSSALASMARCPVLLVESDFGNPYLSRRLGLSSAGGFSELLAGEIDFEDAIFQTSIPGLSILGCGIKTEQQALEIPFDLLSPIINENLNKYNYMIFDLPLASQLSTCHSITPKLDGVILTGEANQLDQSQIGRFRQQMENQGTDILGVIINKSWN